MLSGARMDFNQSIFCSRCLRGVEKSEFKSLITMKGSVNPPCPFCSSTSWIAFNYNIEVDLTQ